MASKRLITALIGLLGAAADADLSIMVSVTTRGVDKIERIPPDILWTKKFSLINLFTCNSLKWSPSLREFNKGI